MCVAPALQPVPVTLPASAHAFSMLQALRVNPPVPGSSLVNPFPLPCPQSSSRQAVCLHHGCCPLIPAFGGFLEFSVLQMPSARSWGQRRTGSVSVLGQGVQGASLRLHETCVCLSKGMEGLGELECGVSLKPLTSFVLGETGAPAGFERETDMTCPGL